MKYIITLGRVGSADCGMRINDKEYGVESDTWNLIGCFWDISNQEQYKIMNTKKGQKILKFIYKKFKSDLL